MEITRTVLALSQLPKVGRVRLKQYLTRIEWTEATLSLFDAVSRFQLTEFSTTDLDSALARADILLEKCGSLGVAVHPFRSPSYPKQLERLREPPALLFSKGNFDPNRTPRVAVIGTRHPTDWGLETATACAGQISESGGVVVSGLALGIDAAAQAATLEHNAPTWAVLAHGLHTVSPASNRDLAKRIVDQGGALISEYAPGEAAQRHYFVERDRIQAGLSDAVLVIESDIGGGAMHTVRFAREAYVPVWATLPSAKSDGNDLDDVQRGTWELIRTNAATRVLGLKSLDKMVRDLASTPVSPRSLFAQ